MLKISSVQPGSPAARCGLREGDAILSIQGEPVRDILDLHFHSSGVGTLRLEIERSGRTRRISLRREAWEPMGVDFRPTPVRRCGNRCIFCFIDQNPGGMRPSLYVKDEDYRLSFLHGNFVTLTNLKDWELHRILEQRLSPLYISVHSLNPEIRRRMLCSSGRSDIRPVMQALDRAGIQLHTQIVLVPDYNDGSDLEATLEELAGYRGSVASVGIVPVGLTRHREGLPRLRTFRKAEARRLFERIEPRQEAWRRERGAAFVYLADEFYLMAGHPLPSESEYDGYPQIENGIGLVRSFSTRLRRLRRVFPRYQGSRGVTLATGRLFAPHLERMIQEMMTKTGETLPVRVAAVPNRFFGAKVTVAGLLTGGDMVRALRDRDLGDQVVIPPASVNQDGVFLDGMRPAELASALGTPVAVGLRNREF